MLTAHAFVLAALQVLPGSSSDTTPPAFVQPPVLTASPNASTPLCARLVVHASEPVQVQILADDGSRSWRFAPSDDYAVQQDLALAGFRPSRAHTLRVLIFDHAGNRALWPAPLVFTTPPLPANFPPLHVTVSDPPHMESGVTLTALRYSSPSLPGSGTYVVFLNASGQVVWLYQSTEAIVYGAIRLRNGHVLLIAGNQLAREIDLLGNVVAQWWAARHSIVGMPPGAILVDCDNFHHELHELPAGDVADFVALSEELRVLPNYPASEVDPTITQPSANVLGDVVVEFRRDGTVVGRRSLFDVVDPYRICYGSLAPVNSAVYGVVAYDWTHGNGVDLDPADQTFVVSMRHQDALVKIGRADGALRWILGAHERWNPPWSASLLTPVGAPFEWQFHQHSPHVESAGNVVMFDNGNYRVIPPTPWGPTDLFYSRAVRFHVDPFAHTVAQTWEHDGGSQSFFSPFYGDADPQPHTRNVLITDGARRVPGENRTYARIAEVTRFTPGTMVFEVIVNDPAAPPSSPYNWSIYRSERYPSVYP